MGCTVIATEKVPKGNVAGNVGCLVSDRVILSGPSHPERAQDISRA